MNTYRDASDQEYYCLEGRDTGMTRGVNTCKWTPCDNVGYCVAYEDSDYYDEMVVWEQSEATSRRLLEDGDKVSAHYAGWGNGRPIPTPRPTNPPKTPRPTTWTAPKTPKPTNPPKTPKPTVWKAPKTPKPTRNITPKPTKNKTPRPTFIKTPRPTKDQTPRPTRNTVKTPRPTKDKTPKPTSIKTPRPTKVVTPRPTKNK